MMHSRIIFAWKLQILAIIIHLKNFSTSKFHSVTHHTTNQSDKSESSMHLHSNESNNSQGISPVERGTPTHCSGLVTLEGINGTIDTGSGTPPSPNDCRWIIISPNVSQIKLTFSQFDVPGIFGRVWIFVGDKDVARWKYDDVIETGRAFTSFNGEFDSRPIDCPSNIVLIIFQTEDSDSTRSGFHMSWEGLKWTADGKQFNIPFT